MPQPYLRVPWLGPCSSETWGPGEGVPQSPLCRAGLRLSVLPQPFRQVCLHVAHQGCWAKSPSHTGHTVPTTKCSFPCSYPLNRSHFDSVAKST